MAGRRLERRGGGWARGTKKNHKATQPHSPLTCGQRRGEQRRREGPILDPRGAHTSCRARVGAGGGARARGAGAAQARGRIAQRGLADGDTGKRAHPPERVRPCGRSPEHGGGRGVDAVHRVDHGNREQRREKSDASRVRGREYDGARRLGAVVSVAARAAPARGPISRFRGAGSVPRDSGHVRVDLGAQSGANRVGRGAPVLPVRRARVAKPRPRLPTPRDGRERRQTGRRARKGEAHRAARGRVPRAPVGAAARVAAVAQVTDSQRRRRV